eukprot:4999250-Prymnesium_polylepis.3
MPCSRTPWSCREGKSQSNAAMVSQQDSALLPKLSTANYDWASRRFTLFAVLASPSRLVRQLGFATEEAEARWSRPKPPLQVQRGRICLSVAPPIGGPSCSLLLVLRLLLLSARHFRHGRRCAHGRAAWQCAYDALQIHRARHLGGEGHEAARERLGGGLVVELARQVKVEVEAGPARESCGHLREGRHGREHVGVRLGDQKEFQQRAARAFP